MGGLELVSSSPTSGLGLISKQSLKTGDVLLQVPANLALSVQTPTDDNSKITSLFPNNSDAKALYKEAPWWVQLSLQLIALDLELIPTTESSANSKKTTLFDIPTRPWLDVLPRSFSTPFHWSSSTVAELQYPFLSNSITNQKTTWNKYYDDIMKSNNPFSQNKQFTFDKFVWGCECARSRAFSGTYAGSAFNPMPYAFTLLLITVYVGLNLGTLEQAANGAALVVCGSILKDFVAPKLLGSGRKYVICPYIDMANHVGYEEDGDVAFEYFSDSYSLSVKTSSPIAQQKEFMITYGPRSNDQLLQYYGFVEADNVHDVYVMPPLRDWDIAALEAACGRTFSAGRLQKLDRAGLLGTSIITSSDDKNNNLNAANSAGGVVLTRAGGIDPAVLQALRALVSTDDEWDASGEAVGNFALENAGGAANELAAKKAAKAQMQIELNNKATTIEEDEQLLKKAKVAKSMDLDENDVLAIQFRLEKKKLLQEIIDSI